MILLERGQIFELEGKKFFTFGGASSHDIQGGILERDDPNYRETQAEIEETGLPYRINHVSWWAEELPSEEEMEEGRKNLEKVDYNVDYVITHCLSNISQDLLCKTTLTRYGSRLSYGYDILTSYLEEIEAKLNYEHWFCGHYHVNQLLDAHHTVLYEQIVPLDYYTEGKYAIKCYLNK